MTRNETEIADAHIQEKYMRIAHVGAILSIIHKFPSIIHYCLSTATFQVTVESFSAPGVAIADMAEATKE
jgi:hypothetical protein